MIDLKYEYQTIRDIPVTILTFCEKMMVAGIEVILPKDSRLKVSHNYNPGDQYLHCSLVNGDAFEQQIVSVENRNHPDYNGISISMKLSDLTTHCVPIEHH